MTAYLALAAGLLLAVGIGMVVVGLTPRRPDLASAVNLLLPEPDAPMAPSVAAQVGARGWLVRVLLPGAAERLGLARFAADLRLLDRTVEHLAAQKLGYGLLGLVFPTVLTGLLAAAGIRAPAAVPVAVGLVLGGVLFWIPDLMVRREATATRSSMRAAIGAYIDLVALERLADAGTTEALDWAAAIGESPEFDRLRDALLRAQLAGRPAWTGLAELAERTGVVELGDLADIMAVAGHDGAAVYATLRARAASLRTQLLTTQVADANAASEHMVVPVSLLGLCFMALVAYPAFVRIMFG